MNDHDSFELNISQIFAMLLIGMVRHYQSIDHNWNNIQAYTQLQGGTKNFTAYIMHKFQFNKIIFSSSALICFPFYDLLIF